MSQCTISVALAKGQWSKGYTIELDSPNRSATCNKQTLVQCKYSQYMYGKLNNKWISKNISQQGFSFSFQKSVSISPSKLTH